VASARWLAEVLSTANRFNGFPVVSRKPLKRLLGLQQDLPITGLKPRCEWTDQAASLPAIRDRHACRRALRGQLVVQFI